MATNSTLTADALRQMVEYRDGELFWRVKSSSRKMGKPIGAPAGLQGRLQCQIAGSHHYVHRLIWLFHHGAWPTDQIDHINGHPTDNRVENLREADAAMNSRNKRVRGISFDKRSAERPWRARIMVDGRSISLGYFSSEADAMAEYQRAKLIYHPAYASGIAAA